MRRLCEVRLRWLEGEGAMMMFPAGEVSHFDVRARCVTDPPWSRAVAMLARKARAAVVPVHFTGENGLLFQIAGFLHPRLRTLMLPGELKRRAGSAVPVRVGAPLPFERLRTFGQRRSAGRAPARDDLSAGARRPAVACRRSSTPTGVGTCIRSRIAGAPADYAGEVARLPARATAARCRRQRGVLRRGRAIPHLLEEIGRLRELTFRAVGEGTGRARDLDSFDEHYEHLFIWNRKREEVVGAYRVGRIDEIRRRAGQRGLYTASLFHYREPFFQLLGPALELGRSFVRPEAQRSFAPLLLLWKGIGEYLARHPRYLRLLGPVSISNDYRELSRQLLVEFLRSHCLDPLLAQLVRPAHPVRARPHGADAGRRSVDARARRRARRAGRRHRARPQGRAGAAAAVPQARRPHARVQRRSGVQPFDRLPAHGRPAADRSARAAQISARARRRAHRRDERCAFPDSAKPADTRPRVIRSSALSPKMAL